MLAYGFVRVIQHGTNHWAGNYWRLVDFSLCPRVSHRNFCHLTRILLLSYNPQPSFSNLCRVFHLAPTTLGAHLFFLSSEHRITLAWALRFSLLFPPTVSASLERAPSKLSVKLHYFRVTPPSATLSCLPTPNQSPNCSIGHAISSASQRSPPLMS